MKKKKDLRKELQKNQYGGPIDESNLSRIKTGVTVTSFGTSVASLYHGLPPGVMATELGITVSSNVILNILKTNRAKNYLGDNFYTFSQELEPTIAHL